MTFLKYSVALILYIAFSFFIAFTYIEAYKAHDRRIHGSVADFWVKRSNRIRAFVITGILLWGFGLITLYDLHAVAQ